jgi:NAD/NADP transhydrogenase alpha subunit
MAITHTETITLMEVLNANTDNIVSKVVVRTVSADVKYTTQKTEAFPISTSGITTSTAGFVAYEDLTESTVLGWIATPLANSKVKENNEKIIARMIEIDNPTSVDKALPW